jgi:hypothetical protein
MRADRCLCRNLEPMNTAVAPIRRSYRRILAAPWWEARCGPTVVSADTSFR